MQPVNGTITQWFDTPVSYFADRKTHQAIDIVTEGSQPVRNPQAGKVTKVIDIYNESQKTGFGNELWILHNNGLYSRFCHLNKGIQAKVGEHVSTGQISSYTGRTGYRSPESVWHLHYEVYDNGIRIDPLSVNWEEPINPPNDEDMRLRVHEKYTLYAAVPPGQSEKTWFVVRNDKKSRFTVDQADIDDTSDLFSHEVFLVENVDKLLKIADGGRWNVGEAARKYPEILLPEGKELKKVNI